MFSITDNLYHFNLNTTKYSYIKNSVDLVSAVQLGQT